MKLVAGETEPHRNLTAIDQLLTAGKHDAALAILSPDAGPEAGQLGTALPRRRDPRGQGQDATRRRPGSTPSSRMKLPDDELSEITKNQIKQAKKKATAAPKPGQPAAYNPYAAATTTSRLPAAHAADAATSTRSATPIGMETAELLRRQQPPPFYAPSDYGEARMACLGWLYELARAKGDARRLRQATPRRQGQGRRRPAAAVGLVLLPDAAATSNKDLLADRVRAVEGHRPGRAAGVPERRLGTCGATAPRVPPAAADETKDTTPPLPADQLAHAARLLPEAQAGQAGVGDRPSVTQTVMTELKRAKKRGRRDGHLPGDARAPRTPSTRCRRRIEPRRRAQRPGHRARPVRQARQAPGAGEDRRQLSPTADPAASSHARTR